MSFQNKLIIILIAIILLLSSFFLGYIIFRDKSNSAGSTTSQSSEQAEFNVNFKILAFTMKGTQFPSHSITYELYVNDEKIRTLDGTGISIDFPNVPVKNGDVISGRALWKNGFGAVSKVNASYQDTKTINESDRGQEINISTYDAEYLSSPETRGDWY